MLDILCDKEVALQLHRILHPTSAQIRVWHQNKPMSNCNQDHAQHMDKMKENAIEFQVCACWTTFLKRFDLKAFVVLNGKQSEELTA